MDASAATGKKKRKKASKGPPAATTAAAAESTAAVKPEAQAAETGAAGTAKVAKAKPPRKPRRRKSTGPRFDTSDDGGAPVTVRRRRRPLIDDGEVVVVRKRKKKKKKKKRDAKVKPSPPLEKTDPLTDYLAGQQVPCPVGCGGFSEIVRVATLETGEGEVWFECLSCAQRRHFTLPKAKRAENAAIGEAEEAGREINCPRHSVAIGLRRRGRQFVCPSCGVVFSP